MVENMAEVGITVINTGVMVGVFFRLGVLIEALKGLSGRVDKLEQTERELKNGMVGSVNKSSDSCVASLG